MIATLIAIYCPNRLCPEVLRMGKAQIVGRVQPGSVSELRCPKCRNLYVLTAEESRNRV